MGAKSGCCMLSLYRMEFLCFWAMGKPTESSHAHSHTRQCLTGLLFRRLVSLLRPNLIGETSLVKATITKNT